MLAEYFKRGIAAGVVAGLCYGIFMVVVGNPLVGYLEGAAHGDQGSGHESDHGHAHDGGHVHAHEGGVDHAHEAAHAVSEATTAVVSVGSGVLWAILLGGAFAVAFYLLEPALPGSDAVKAYALAGAGFFAVSVAPWLALPPTAPGAEQAFTADVRLAIYAGLMIVGALVAAGAFLAHRRVTASSGPIPGLAAGALVVGVASVAIYAGSPTIITAGAVPGDLFAAYQGLVVLSQAALWAVLAGTFARLQGRASDSPSIDPDLLEEPGASTGA